MNSTVYISFQKNTIVNDSHITIGSVAKVWCNEPSIAARVKALLIVNAPDVKSRRYVYSVVDIVRLIQKNIDGIEINSVGEPDFIISYKKAGKTNTLIEAAKIAFVTMIVFFGGAFAITAYGNDVDVEGIFGRFSNYINGDEKTLMILEICYCIGITFGVIVFYNHFASRKLEKDPTPLEVGMKLYENDVNTSIIDNSEKEEDKDARS